jgi:hypothetical protein
VGTGGRARERGAGEAARARERALEAGTPAEILYDARDPRRSIVRDLFVARDGGAARGRG